MRTLEQLFGYMQWIFVFMVGMACCGLRQAGGRAEAKRSVWRSAAFVD